MISKTAITRVSLDSALDNRPKGEQNAIGVLDWLSSVPNFVSVNHGRNRSCEL